MRSKLILATLVAAAAPVAAQPVEHPSVDAEPPAPSTAALGVDVAVGGELDPEALRAAIGGELGVAITDAAAFAPALGRLSIAINASGARISYQPAAGTLVERTVALPATPEERVELIAYIATNLVRDQVGDVIANLPARPPIIIIQPASSPSAPPSRPPVVHFPATLGFVPPLSIDRIAGAHVVVGVGVHALVGTTDGSDILSVSGLVDVQRDHASGAQIGGLAAITRALDGGQIGGLAAVTNGHMHGLQVGGIGSVAGSVDGLQIGGITTVSRGRMHGVQLAGIAGIADRVDGVQIAGIANVGRDVDGMQVGLVNVARKMRGVQIGLVNLSDDGDDSYPIGLINYSRNGTLTVDGWVESTRLSAAALRHGTKHIHNIWGIAWSPDYDHMLAGAGLGTHHQLAGDIGLDLDAMNWWTDAWHGNLGQLEQLRATISVPVGAFELIGGAAANVYISDDMDESASFHPVVARKFTSDGGVHVVTWPSVFAGVRLRAR